VQSSHLLPSVRAHVAEETCHRVASWFRMATRCPSPSHPQVFVSTRVQSVSEVQLLQHVSFAGSEGSWHQGICSPRQVMTDASGGGGGGSVASLITMLTVCTVFGSTTATMWKLQSESQLSQMYVRWAVTFASEPHATAPS
jgi:hypothetical protein